MKKYISMMPVTLVLLVILFSCKKNTTVTAITPPTPQAKCVIKTETTGLSGNEKNFEYQFGDKGKLTKVKVLHPTGALLTTYDIGSNTVTTNSTSRYSGKPTFASTRYETSDITTGMPARAFVSINDGDTTRVNYYTYFFFYNDKDLLIKVGEQTDYVIGDQEYDLNIFYNEKGNVTGLQYEWTTGPRDVIPPVTVTAYDDNPTPFAGVKGWPFFMINFAWDNYDPEPILTALSKNNPLDFSVGTGTNLFTRTMVYQYNSDGFPTERKNTNKNENGEYTFLQTFSHTCK